MPARKWAAGIREIVDRWPKDRISGRSLAAGADYIDRLADEVIRLRAALESIAAFAPDEGGAIDPHTQIAVFAKQTARGATGGELNR
jgi:hypothetical protein